MSSTFAAAMLRPIALVGSAVVSIAATGHSAASAQQLPTTHLPAYYVLRLDNEALELLNVHSLFQDGSEITGVVVFAIRDGAVAGVLRRVRFDCTNDQIAIEASAMLSPEGQGDIQRENGRRVVPAAGSTMSDALRIACAPATYYDPNFALDADLEVILSNYWSGD